MGEALLRNPLHIRWLGRVRYAEALELQRGLFERSPADHLLLLEHPDTVTLGVRASETNVIVEPASWGAELVRTDRGGDVTYHGPGQLVGYPILTLADHAAGEVVRTRDYITALETVLIGALGDLGLPGGATLDGFPGVWLGLDTDRPRKIAAVGVRISRGRTMHGFALNVSPELEHFNRIVPCGISDKSVTSLAADGVDATMSEVIDAVVARFLVAFAPPASTRAGITDRRPHDEADLAAFSRGDGPGETVRYGTPTQQSDGTSIRLLGRLAEAGVTAAVALSEPKPDWMRAKVRLGPEVLATKKTISGLGLVTVCEEAGCPNLSECWSDGTATFMLCGERCTRACGFCLVDTRFPEPLDPTEPDRVAQAVERMGLEYVVLTMVARDDLNDGGATHVAHTIDAIRRRTPDARIEVLISDLAGSAESLDIVLDARPDVVNHNLETVARMQRAARPSAGYARSLALLARAEAAGFTTKSGFVAGMGETFDEVVEALVDLRGVGVDIVTIGQYLRPTSHHLPVANWWTPSQFEEWKRIGEQTLGIAHIESSPFTRSSHHAKAAASAAQAAGDPVPDTPIGVVATSRGA